MTLPSGRQSYISMHSPHEESKHSTSEKEKEETETSMSASFKARDNPFERISQQE